MKLIFILLLLFITPYSFTQDIKKGTWNAQLHLNSTDILPFIMKVDKNNQITLMNAEESIQLDSTVFKNDSLYVRFPYFNSELVFVATKKKLTGYWVNYQKGPHYKIPFSAECVSKKTPRFASVKKSKINIEGKWHVKFEPGKEGEYPSLGIFSQEKNKVSGTFLTETGDYRFLEGKNSNDSLFLSCFDGSHAFLFKAKLENDSLFGTFNSGSHWKSEWNGVRDDNFKLADPEKITYLINEQPITFSFPNLQKDTIQFPNKQTENKVVIIQIMGTWCPNCLDETMLFKEIYNEYHEDGLEIISVCYEAGKTLEDQISSAQRLKSKLEIEYPFLIGGRAVKDKAGADFSMLNSISSFPTTIVIDRNGDVKQIYTGFNGPSTGIYYTEYKKRLNTLIQSLLKIQ